MKSSYRLIPSCAKTSDKQTGSMTAHDVISKTQAHTHTLNVRICKAEGVQQILVLTDQRNLPGPLLGTKLFNIITRSCLLWECVDQQAKIKEQTC